MTHVGQDFSYTREYALSSVRQWHQSHNWFQNLALFATVHAKCVPSQQQTALHAMPARICLTRDVTQLVQQVMSKKSSQEHANPNS